MTQVRGRRYGSPMRRQSSPAATASEASSLLVFIAYRQGADEGDACATWLNKTLMGRELPLETKDKVRIRTYFDQLAPAIHDWTQKWRGDLRTARAMILVCSKSTSARRDGRDWLHDEIDWWIRRRRTAPILVIAVGAAATVQDSRVPPAVLKKWPYAQRIAWSPAFDDEKQTRVVDRIAEGLALSERGITYEELRRLQVRNRGLLVLTVTTLLLGIGLFFFAQSERDQRNLAVRNLQLAYGPSLQLAMTAVDQREITVARGILLSIQPQLRRDEWALVRNFADQSDRTWTEAAKINAIDYSPDGRFIALGRDDGRVLVRVMRGDLTARDQEFTADGSRVTSQQTVSLPDGTPVQRTVSAKTTVNRLVFIGNEELATAGNDGVVHVWDVAARSTEALEPAAKAARRTLAVSPNGRWLASGTETGFVHVWSVSPRVESVAPSYPQSRH